MLGKALRKNLSSAIYAFTLCILIIISFLPALNIANAESAENPIIANMISKIDESEIYTIVSTLQNFGSRCYGYLGNNASALWIYNQLSDIPKLSVEYQSQYNNIIATLVGANTHSNALYIVGAHYDSFSSNKSDAPGATDNGGGVAIVLELAKIMSQYSFSSTLKFAFWNNEENGALGSTEYAKQLSDSGAALSLYINFDSACYDPENRLILDIMFNEKSSWVSDMMTDYNTLYGINFNLTYNLHNCYSDHASFWGYGYTAVMTHSESHGPAHTPQDNVDEVSKVYAKKNGQLGMALLASLAEVQSPPTPTPIPTLTPNPTSIIPINPTNKPAITPTIKPTLTPTAVPTPVNSSNQPTTGTENVSKPSLSPTNFLAAFSNQVIIVASSATVLFVIATVALTIPRKKKK